MTKETKVANKTKKAGKGKGKNAAKKAGKKAAKKAVVKNPVEAVESTTEDCGKDVPEGVISTGDKKFDALLSSTVESVAKDNPGLVGKNRVAWALACLQKIEDAAPEEITLLHEKMGKVTQTYFEKLVKVFVKFYEIGILNKEELLYLEDIMGDSADEFNNTSRVEQLAVVFTITTSVKEYNEHKAVIRGIIEKVEKSLGVSLDGADVTVCRL